MTKLQKDKMQKVEEDITENKTKDTEKKFPRLKKTSLQIEKAHKGKKILPPSHMCKFQNTKHCEKTGKYPRV